MTRFLTFNILFFLSLISFAQLPLGFDTITVIENGYAQKMAWGNGLNYSNFSNIDLNFDGKKDLVAFDKLNQFGVGRFRCFIKTGVAGQETYTINTGYSYSFPQIVTNWAIFHDYNCDGKEDLFCSTNGGIMVYKNTSVPGTINFTLEKPLLYSFYPGSGYANLYASPAGVPGIADMDNDGDLDVMTFAPQGVFVEYHQNMSKEAYGNCNHLDTFLLNTGCWGKIIENNCTITFSQTCAMKPWPDYHPELQNGETRHAGSCLTCLDIDGDLDKELLMGDVSCNHVQLAYNGGSVASALVTDSTKLYPNYPNKSNTTQIKMNNFPCTYYVDVNGDGKKDLIATPNAFGSENYKSTWYYNNASSTGTLNFQFVKNNFLQDEMIEVGQNSFPAVFDYNADGKKDLLVGTFGYYNSGFLKAQLTLYENKGTTAQPSYSLVTRDYAALSTQSLSYAIPYPADMDADGDIDLLIGTSQGQVHLLRNTAGAGNPCTFTFVSNPYSFTSPAAIAVVQAFDINKDGKPDLMLGGKGGKIQYYKNIGTAAAPSYTLQSSFFGKINVQGDPNLYGIDGYSAPFFYDEGTATKLLVGSVSGQIFHYAIPTLVNDTCTAILLNANTNGINEGAQSTVWYEDVNGDSKRDLFVGNAGGGLNFLSSKAPDVGIHESGLDVSEFVSVYPVPSHQELTVLIKKMEAGKFEVVLYDLLGKQTISATFHSNKGTINIGELPKGIYFAKVIISTNSSTYSITKKIVKE